MDRRLLGLLGGVLVFLLGIGLAAADNGPHGGYTPTTDACAGCHRAHTALGPNLLKASTVADLCFSCHGSTASGADTNVADGIYMERDTVTESPAEGVDNRGLKGGGFVNALMDTDWNLTTPPVLTSTTSSHIYDGSPGTLWGNGAIGSGPGTANFTLTCTNCHDPHGSGNYRILRPIPTGSGATTGVTIPDESSKIYTISNADGEYFGENYGSRAQYLSQWCAQCHTRYLASSGSARTDSGDPIFRYRHTTLSFSVSCLACHVAHGTTAKMTGFAANGVLWPDGSNAPAGDSRSSLLRLDNRGVCEQCHLK